MLKNKKRILFIIFATVALSFLFFQRDYEKDLSYLSGDEPHYIMMADSLVKDGDFNLKNDYELERSKDFYPGPSLYPHNSPLVEEGSDKWYSIHTIGVPLAVALPYKLFGVTGARVWMMLIQFSAIVIFYLILKKYLKSEKRALIGAGLLILCPLIWQNMGSFFPDLILITFWLTSILLFGRKDKWSNLAIIACGVISGLSHTKGLILIAPIILFHVFWLIHKSSIADYVREQWLSISFAVGSLLLYVYFLYLNYGIISPSQLYGDNGQLFGANPIYNTVAMLTDRNKGLFVHFPLLLVAAPYLIFMIIELAGLASNFVKRNLKTTVNHFLVAGLILGLSVLLVTVIGFQDWSGSTAPNGRSMLPFIIGAIFVTAKYIRLQSRVEVLLLGVAAALSGWLSWLSIYDFKTYMSPGVNSFWVDRFEPLANLPLFGFVSIDTGRAPLLLGIKLLTCIAVINALLFVLYKYKIIFKPQPTR